MLYAYRYEWVKKDSKESLGGLCRASICDDFLDSLHEAYRRLMNIINFDLQIPPMDFFAAYDWKTESYFTERGYEKFSREIKKVMNEVNQLSEYLDFELVEIVVPIENLEVVYRDAHQFLSLPKQAVTA